MWFYLDISENKGLLQKITNTNRQMVKIKQDLICCFKDSSVCLPTLDIDQPSVIPCLNTHIHTNKLSIQTN